MSVKVAIIGDSHLAAIAGSTFPIVGDLDLKFKRGGKLDFLETCVDDMEWSMFAPPDVVVIFLGGNDVDSLYCDVPAIANRILGLIDRLEAMARKVYIMRQWPRPGARHGDISYWTNVQYLEKLLNDSGRVRPWAWDKVQINIRKLFVFYALPY